MLIKNQLTSIKTHIKMLYNAMQCSKTLGRPVWSRNVGATVPEGARTAQRTRTTCVCLGTCLCTCLHRHLHTCLHAYLHTGPHTCPYTCLYTCLRWSTGSLTSHHVRLVIMTGCAANRTWSAALHVAVVSTTGRHTTEA